MLYREDPKEHSSINSTPVFWWDAIRRIWPAPERQLAHSVPDSIRAPYNEAVKALDVNLAMAASVMVGRALEAVCKEFEPKTRGIHDGLKLMLNSGALSPEMHEWADSIRILRNAGAHSTDKEFTLEEVRDALDFLQALITIIFEVRPKFENHKKKQEANKA